MTPAPPGPTAPALSVLDLVPVSAGRTRAAALAETVALAQATEAAGYLRYWVGEHHGSTTYLASATTVLMGQLLAATTRIGVASGGVMLPNHAPLVIAEQVGTLATMYPGRVGLGLGRAPGTDALTARALRRRPADPSTVADDVLETLAYLGAVDPDMPLPPVPGSLSSQALPWEETEAAAVPGEGRSGAAQRVRAVPGEGTSPRTWVLASSVNGARLAGRLGLPLVVAAHFAPRQAEAAVAAYHSVFDATAPSAQVTAPSVSAAVNAVVAPTRPEAERLFTTTQAVAARTLAGRPAPLDDPGPHGVDWRALAGPRAGDVEASLACSHVGGPEEVADGLRALSRQWGLEEVLVVTTVHGAQERRRSYELLAQAWRS